MTCERWLAHTKDFKEVRNPPCYCDLRLCNWRCEAFLPSFSIVVSQAMLRGLPIENCGCFGESLSFSLPTMLIADCLLLVVAVILLYRIHQTRVYSLDKYFLEK